VYIGKPLTTASHIAVGIGNVYAFLIHSHCEQCFGRLKFLTGISQNSVQTARVSVSFLCQLDHLCVQLIAFLFQFEFFFSGALIEPRIGSVDNLFFFDFRHFLIQNVMIAGGFYEIFTKTVLFKLSL
jgi:hypothetical protein